MQVERMEPCIVDGELEMKTAFDQAVQFNQEHMEKLLEEKTVETVHVFKATPRNMKMAALREEYPDATRKELRKLLKKWK